MGMIWSWGWRLSVLGVVAGICYFFGRSIPFEEQWPIYESLRTTGSIVFAVVGAWIALIYPEALARVFDRRAPSADEVDHISVLLKPMIYSTLILLFVIGVGITVPILKRVDFLLSYALPLRGVSYGLLGVATVVQIWSVLLALAPADRLQTEIRTADNRKRRLARLRTNIQAPRRRTHARS